MRTIGSLILGSLLLAPGPAAAAPAEAEGTVRVLNFPDIQRVEGTVTVEGRLDVARSVSFEKVALPPAPPEPRTAQPWGSRPEPHRAARRER